MQRRGFLSTAAVGAGAAGAAVVLPTWLTGCGGVHTAPELGARETVELLSRLDRGLESAGSTPMAGLEGALPWRTRLDVCEPALRLGAQALVVADVARSIPANTSIPEELRGRLLETLPILDRCTSAYHRLLTHTPPAVRRNVDADLRRAPGTVMDIAAFLDERAGQVGISTESRARLRSNASWVTTRMRRQSTSAVVDDCVEKVERTVARSGASLASLGDAGAGSLVDAIWAAIDVGDDSAGLAAPAPPPGYVSTSSGVYVPPDAEIPPGAETPESGSPGDSELTAGGIVLASGPVVFGLGTLIGGAAGSWMWGAIIAATPGAILVVVGIVLLIVGAVQNGRAASRAAEG